MLATIIERAAKLKASGGARTEDVRIARTRATRDVDVKNARAARTKDTKDTKETKDTKGRSKGMKPRRSQGAGITRKKST
jgi:hypothetical protein